jgi:hypothetical protein
MPILQRRISIITRRAPVGHFRAVACVVLAMSLLACTPPAAPAQRSQSGAKAPPSAATLRVMTFNLRYDNPGDGANAWARRRDTVVRVVHAFKPDLLGTQEALAGQADFLREALAWVSAGTMAGAPANLPCRSTRPTALIDSRTGISG